MASTRQPLIAGLLLLEIVPGVNWVWTLSLGLIGIA